MAKSIEERYEDAYRVGENAIALGRIVKVIGFVFGAAVLLAGLVGLSGLGGGLVVMGALFLAIVVGMCGYIAGVFMAAQGEMIRAALDIAVNTSSLRTVHQA